MVLAARDEDCMEDVLIIASALSVQDPRERPMDKQQAADEAHKQFRDENSDFMSYPEAVELLPLTRPSICRAARCESCARANFISYVRMREWHDVHQQLREIVGEMGLLHAGRPAPNSRSR